MGVHTFDDLKAHIGHELVCVGYGDVLIKNKKGKLVAGSGPLCNVAIECETCNEVLLDFDKEKNVKRRRNR